MNKIVAKNLKALRESCLVENRPMSGAEFAAKCGLHQRTYNRLEQGEGWQHLQLLQIIAIKNDLQVWQLLAPNFNPKQPPILKVAGEVEKKLYASIQKAFADLIPPEK